MQPTEIFSISPGTNIMDVLGHSGYSFDFAIADLIDNCLAAKASKVKLYFDVKSKAPYLPTGIAQHRSKQNLAV